MHARNGIGRLAVAALVAGAATFAAWTPAWAGGRASDRLTEAGKSLRGWDRDEAPASAASSSCSQDAGLPVPVFQTLYDQAVGLEEVVAESGQSMPVDIAAQIGDAGGCTSVSPASGNGSVEGVSCSMDAGLPVPVFQTLYENAKTLQDTVRSTAGQSLPVDIAAQIASAGSCRTEAAPESDSGSSFPSSDSGTSASPTTQVLGEQLQAPEGEGEPLARTGAALPTGLLGLALIGAGGAVIRRFGFHR